MADFQVLIVAIPVLESDVAGTVSRLLADNPAAVIAEIQKMTDADYLRVNLPEFDSFCTVYCWNRPDMIDFRASTRILYNRLLHEVFEKKIDLSTSPGNYGWSVRDIVMVATPGAVRTEDITQSFPEDILEVFEAWRQQLARQVAAVDSLLANPSTVG